MPAGKTLKFWPARLELKTTPEKFVVRLTLGDYSDIQLGERLEGTNVAWYSLLS